MSSVDFVSIVVLVDAPWFQYDEICGGIVSFDACAEQTFVLFL